MYSGIVSSGEKNNIDYSDNKHRVFTDVSSPIQCALVLENEKFLPHLFIFVSVNKKDNNGKII